MIGGIELGLLCLALNIWHEARGLDRQAQLAVAHVTLNRARMDASAGSTSHETVHSICSVVYAPYQMSWTLLVVGADRIPPPNSASWITAQYLAQDALTSPDFTGGSLWYHRYDITPWWVWNKEMTGRWGDHVFYVCKQDAICGWPKGD
jgi:spore germination cell wall hydrolase CwlJ-like protein